MTDLACVACSIDPQTTSLLVPLAQASLISAPIFLRGRIVKLVRSRLRRRGTTADPGADCGDGRPEAGEMPRR